MKFFIVTGLLLSSLTSFAQNSGTGPGNTRDLKECQKYFKESEEFALLSMDARLSLKARGEMLELSLKQRDLGRACISGPGANLVSVKEISSKAKKYISSCNEAKAEEIILVAINQSMDARLSLSERNEMLELGTSLKDEYLVSCVR